MVLFNPNLGDKGIHTFPKVISPKVNAPVLPEFERADYDATVLHVSHNVSWIPFYSFRSCCLSINQPFLGYLMPKFDSFLNFRL